MTAKNLKPTGFPLLQWEPQNLAKPLDKLCTYATIQAQEAIDWYFHRKQLRRYLCRVFRISAILLVAFAGVLPLINEVLGKDSSIHSLWSTLALAAAATIILLDRFYGFTTGWIRFMQAGQQLSQALEIFQLEIELEKLKWGRLEPTQEESFAMLRQVQQFLKQLRGIVKDETMQWAAEFTEVLKQVDEQVKLVAQAEKKSALQIAITNGDHCTDGWMLTVGDRSPEKRYGKEGSVEVLPDLYVVRIEAQIDSKPVRAERAVKVNPAEIQTLELTLS